MRERLRAVTGRARRFFDFALADDRANSTIAISMALITVLATGVAFLQQDASIRAGRAEREAERIGLAAVGHDVGTLVQAGTDYGVFRRWFEELQRGAWASEQAAEEPEGYDPAFLEALSAIDYEIADWAKLQSALLQPPYFNEATFETDFAAYDAEQNVGPRERAEHEHDIQLAVASEWDSRSLAYVTILTILAASLFFLGLGASLTRAARPIFAATGALFAVLSLGWTVSAAMTPIDEVSPAAVDDAVRAQVEMARITSWDLPEISEIDRQHFEEALSAADAAIAAAPDYPRVYLTRGEVKLGYGDTLYFGVERDEALVEWLLEGAIGDLQTYLRAEPDDYSAWWNLGWAQYLAGHNEASVASTNRALELSKHFALYLNRSLAKLSMGDVEGSEADVEVALEVARVAALDSTQSFFAEADRELARLMELRPDEAEGLAAQRERLHEGQVALDVFNATTPNPDAPGLDVLLIYTLILQPDGTIAEGEEIADGGSFSQVGHAGFSVGVGAREPTEETMVSVRIWRDGLLETGSSADVPWSEEPGYEDIMLIEVVSPYGYAGFDIDPGQYEAQVFFDAKLAGTVRWEVTAE